MRLKLPNYQELTWSLYNKAESFVFVSPEYNGGVPPALTNIIAWVSRLGGKDWRKSFNGKAAALARSILGG